MKNLFLKVSAALTAGLASSAVFAADHTVAIDSAYADGTTNVTAAVVGIIALAAIITGVGYILKFLNR